MKLGEGVNVDFEQGELVARVKVAAVINPKLDELKAKIQSGEIDPIKSTSLDNTAMLMAIDFLKAEINK